MTIEAIIVHLNREVSFSSPSIDLGLGKSNRGFKWQKGHLVQGAADLGCHAMLSTPSKCPSC